MPSYRRLGAAIGLAFLLCTLAATAVSAHVVKTVGPYRVAIGWLKEPTYVGEQNAVQVVIHDARGDAVDDLSPDDLQVVVGTGGQESKPMSLAPTFDEDTGLGIPGDYDAPIIPTAPGDYTFHVTGTIHGTAIDETVTSSESTFESAVAPTDIEFPAALPALGEVATRLDRIDARIADAAAAAGEARSAASQALIAGLVVGGLGVLVAAVALYAGWTARRRR
jgi:hypothetical protein